MKRLCILLLFFSYKFSLHAQVIEWQNTIGGSDDDRLYSIQQTVDGGYILCGQSKSNISGDKTENSIGAYDYWIVKTDSSGVIQWQNTIGGNFTEIPTSIEQTADGGFILGGYSNSMISGDKTENCIGLLDYWIIKTDALGNIQWQNTIGGNEDDYLNSIKQTTDGGYILAGYSMSNISGDKTENCIGIWDYWIIKTDTAGIIQWQNTIGGNLEDKLASIEQTSDGGYILVGYSNSNISGDKTENCYGGEDYWMVKTDSSGDIQWQNTIGGNDADILVSMQQTSDGGFILGGYSRSNISGDKIENCIGQFDYWIVKTDALGNIQWQNTIGGNQYDQLTSIEQTNDGGYILGGQSYSDISGDKSENSNGVWDYWIVKTDISGAVQWQNTFGGSDDDYRGAIQLTANGSFILGGYSWSNISGDKTENSNGQEDFWLIKVTDQYNLITGKLFIDTNNNGIQDAGELPVVNKQVIESNTSSFSFSSQIGNYYISVLGSGNFSVSPSLSNYYTSLPLAYSANFTGIQQTDSLNDFAFQPTGIFNDLCVTITPGRFRAGMNASYLITYENVGTTTLSPTVIFFPDDDVSFISASPNASTVTIDSMVWNFGPLAPFQVGSILVTVNVNATTPIGTSINSGAQIEPIAGDADTSCNYSSWEVFTVGSYDPNDILVNEDTLFTNQFPNPPFLEYIIRFQNTGNDTAFTVNILNPIDTNLLELSSIEYVASSHPVNLSWIPWERNMQFKFDNILLPDSNINEPASHGFVRYRIKPKSSVVLGDSITNFAAIYFDFNAPVITNTAITEVVLYTGLPMVAAHTNELRLFPNPTTGIVTIQSNLMSPGCSLLRVTDISGRTVRLIRPELSPQTLTLDVSDLLGGIYFVEWQSDDRVSRTKFIIEH